MKDVLVNNRWKLKLPDHRADRVEWPDWEKERLAAMHKAIKKDDVVFDIGAEEGDLSGLFVTWGAKVVPFEPNPLVWPNIRAVWEYNDLPKPPAYWAGFASDSTVERPSDLEPIFSQPERNGWPACSYGRLIGNHGFRNVSERFHDTPQITIDDFAMKHKLMPDVITIDVEGAEVVVLRGAVKTLNKGVNVFVSVHPEIMEQAYGHTPSQLRDYMQSLGYKGTHLATDHEEHWLWQKS